MKNLNTQEAFDRIIEHAKQMSGRSYDAFIEYCLYRYEGNACFIGALVTDEEAKEMGSMTIDYYKGRLPESLTDINFDMLCAIQSIHDDEKNWENNKFIAWGKLSSIAKEYGVDDSSAKRAYQEQET